VIVDKRFLLDPTLDQVNTHQPELGAKPVVAEITPEILSGEKSLFCHTGMAGPTVCYQLYPGRGGYKSAGDMRPSRREWHVTAILIELEMGSRLFLAQAAGDHQLVKELREEWGEMSAEDSELRHRLFVTMAARVARGICVGRPKIIRRLQQYARPGQLTSGR